MTLRSQIKDLTARLAQAQADLTACRTASLELHNRNDSLVSQVGVLEHQVEVLKAKITELEGAESAAGFENVPAGADLNAVMREAGPGAKLQLPATLKAGTLKPYPGQHLRGPCAITPNGSVDYGMIMQGNDATNVTLEKLDMSGYGRRAVTGWYGMHVLGGRYHNNGEMGLGFDGQCAQQEVAVMDGVKFDHNGSGEWLGHGASGLKFFSVWRVEIKNCEISDNAGNGAWGDFNCGDFYVTNNTIVRNSRKGVFYEKCGGSIGLDTRPAWDAENGLVVKGNTIRNNGSENKEPYAGIGVNTSKHALIEGNTFGNVGAKVAIYIREDPDRLIPASWAGKIGFHVTDVVVGQNTYNGDHNVGCDLPGVTC